MRADATDAPDGAVALPTGEHRERATLPAIPPAIPRDEVAADGRVGAVAYPYRVYEAAVTIERPFVSDRETTYVASVDRSRRLVVRADTFPDTGERTVEDVLVLPAELPDDLARDRARDAVFRWTLRTYSLNHAPEIEFERSTDAYKLFWIAERDGGDVIVDSVRGEEDPLDG